MQLNFLQALGHNLLRGGHFWKILHQIKNQKSWAIRKCCLDAGKTLLSPCTLTVLSVTTHRFPPLPMSPWFRPHPNTSKNLRMARDVFLTLICPIQMIIYKITRSWPMIFYWQHFGINQRNGGNVKNDLDFQWQNTDACQFLSVDTTDQHSAELYCFIVKQKKPGLLVAKHLYFKMFCLLLMCPVWTGYHCS